MNQLHKERLLTLENHLRSGQLGHWFFNFDWWNNNSVPAPPDWKPPVPGCGTTGCAIGECPIAFPDEWEFAGGLPRLRGEREYDDEGHEVNTIEDDGSEFFGITEDEFSALFIPALIDDLISFSVLRPGHLATREQVADHIAAFLAYKQAKGEIT